MKEDDSASLPSDELCPHQPPRGGRGAVMVYHVTFVSHMLAADHSNPSSLLDEHNWSDPMGSSNVLSVWAAKRTPWDWPQYCDRKQWMYFQLIS